MNFSVTRFIKSYGREFDASELKKLFKFEQFVSQPLLEKPKELDPTIIGTAVDHLARFYFNSDVEKSFYVAKIWLEDCLSFYDHPLHKKWKIIGGEDWRFNYFPDHVEEIIYRFYQYFDQCCKIIKRKRANPLAQCRAAYVLAIYISFYRSGIYETPQEYFDQFDRIMNLDLKVFNPLQEMVNRIVNFLKKYGDPVIPDPELHKDVNDKWLRFGSITSGDCDYIAKDALIDVKTDKQTYKKWRYPDDYSVKQLLVYWYMAVKTKRYQIKNLIIYNCFLNLVFTLDLTQININHQTLLDSIGKWIGDSETF